ncbi:MAG TPA: AEC family transporter [bacterium]|nr:AEC family transporter [bacterium]
MFFLTIARDIILPIFLVMALGFWTYQKFHIDLATLSKLNFYVFVPAFMFYSLLIFKPGNREMADSVLFNTLLACANFGAAYALGRWLKLRASLAASATLGVMIFNSANYGIPVVQLAFQGEGVAIQVITITAMNVLTYTLGILVAGGWSEWRKGLQSIIRMPIIYSLIAALLLRAVDWDPPDAIITPLKWVSDGMLPIALLTLGAQLGKSGVSLRHPREVWVTTAARLLLSPFLAFLIIQLMGLHGLLARVLFVSSAFPTAVAVVLFGIEYDKEPHFAAAVVSITTLVSAVTVTLIISLSASLF